jgi:hypothetical protein
VKREVDGGMILLSNYGSSTSTTGKDVEDAETSGYDGWKVLGAADAF